MRLLAIVHEEDAGPGVFGDVVAARGVEVDTWRIAAGERCPDAPRAYDAVLALGGAMHAHEEDAHPWLRDEHAVLAQLVQHGVPVLGVCLGAQILARAGGGTTSLLGEPEIGWYEVDVGPAGHEDPVLGPLAPRFTALQWHGCAFTPAATARTLAVNARCSQAYRLGRSAWGIQFHAEVTLDDYESWIDQYGGNGIDSDALRRATRTSIRSWNGLGRALFGRFLVQAAAVRA